MNNLTLDDIIIELNRPYPDLVDSFSQAYDFVTAEFANDIRILPSKFERICRFCEKTYPEVTFNNEAHSIPEFLGNHHLLSPYECDRCNKLFSIYENQFSKFFGHLITISGTKGKKGIPNSRSGDNKTIAQKEKFYQNESGILFGNTNLNEKNIKYDKENNIFEITSYTEKYIPISIYKILVKMAVGILPEYSNEISKELNPFLLDKKHKNHIDHKLFKMIVYTSSIKYEATSIFLFKKITKENIPDFCFILFYDHFMMQIFIPLSFTKSYSNFSIYPILSPVLNTFGDVTLNFKVEFINLNTKISECRKIKHFFRIDYDPSKAIAVDINTGEQKDISLDLDNIKQFILVEKGKEFQL